MPDHPVEMGEETEKTVGKVQQATEDVQRGGDESAKVSTLKRPANDGESTKSASDLKAVHPGTAKLPVSNVTSEPKKRRLGLEEDMWEFVDALDEMKKEGWNTACREGRDLLTLVQYTNDVIVNKITFNCWNFRNLTEEEEEKEEIRKKSIEVDGWLGSLGELMKEAVEILHSRECEEHLLEHIDKQIKRLHELLPVSLRRS